MQTATHLLFKKLVLTGILVLLAPTLLWAQQFTTANHANWYKPDAGVHSSLLVWRKSPDTLQVLASVRLDNGREISSYSLRLHLRKELHQDQGSTPIPLNIYKKAGSQHVARTDIPIRDSLEFLLLEVQDTLQPGTSFWSVATLKPEHTYEPPSFYLSQEADSIPLFRNYKKPGEQIFIQGDFPFYTLFFYQSSFDAAAPPLSASQSSNASLEVTETRILNADSTLSSLPGEGLYFIQHDTSELSGLSFRVGSTYFPEIGTLEEFAGPIRYLSTTDEWTKMASNEFSKKEIDRFWLKVAQTEDRAKRIIRTYYNQVALANHYFTTYKEGWKTDQGMIYILYGAPEIVTVEEDREIWIYPKTIDLPEIKFTFVRVKNPFTDRHFVLLRNKNYQRTHYQVVSQWRRGKKTL